MYVARSARTLEIRIENNGGKCEFGKVIRHSADSGYDLVQLSNLEVLTQYQSNGINFKNNS